MNPEAAKDPDRQLIIRVLSADLVHETCRALGEPDPIAADRNIIPKVKERI